MRRRNQLPVGLKAQLVEHCVATKLSQLQLSNLASSKRNIFAVFLSDFASSFWPEICRPFSLRDK